MIFIPGINDITFSQDSLMWDKGLMHIHTQQLGFSWHHLVDKLESNTILSFHPGRSHFNSKQHSTALEAKGLAAPGPDQLLTPCENMYKPVPTLLCHVFSPTENTYGQNIPGFPWNNSHPAKALLLASVIDLPDFGLLPGKHRASFEREHNCFI